MSYPEQQMQQHIEAGITEAEHCYERIAALEGERDVLAAQVQQLSILCLAYSKNEPLPKLTKELFEPCLMAEKYLAAHDAEVAANAVEVVAKVLSVTIFNKKSFYEYAAQLRAKGPNNQD